MKSDFQISNECEKKHIAEVAGKLGIKEEDLKMILSISVFLSVRNQMIIRK